MKRNRIISALLAFILVFSLFEMSAQPAYATKPSDVGISVSKLTRTYNNDTGKYTLKVTLNNGSYSIVKMSAYLYNADGKRLVSWTNDDQYYRVSPTSSSTLGCTVNFSKYSSSSYTFVLQANVSTLYNSVKGAWEEPVFKWKWTIKKEDVSGPSISFKSATLRTLDDGRVVPRINIKCTNIKGQSLRMYVYDGSGELVYKSKEGPKRSSNSETAWFSWGGKADGQQYPDGNYTVKIVSSGGLKISKKFYLDFPYNNK